MSNFLKEVNGIPRGTQVQGTDIGSGAATSTQILTANGSGGSAFASLTASALPTITLTGNVTGSASGGSIATTIAGSAVTLSMLANLAANSVIGNATGSSATPTAVSMTNAATASTLVYRDANANTTVNNLIEGYATTATAATTTTLTVSSKWQQYFTGSTTQTVVLPVTSTLVTGQSYLIVNNSTGVVTVQSSGGNTLQAMAAGYQLVATVISTSGTGTASWSWAYTPLVAQTLTSLGIRSGNSSISSSATSVSVTFSTAFSNTSYSITANMLNTTDSNPKFQPIDVTAQSTTGFTASWNVPTDTANYVLSWQAIVNN